MSWIVWGCLLACGQLCWAKAPGQYVAVLREFGGPEKFLIEDGWPIPRDALGDECWLLVKASAVYPWDKWARWNNGTRRRLEAPAVLGQEVSGIVIQCGPNVTHVEQAQRVFAKMPNYEGGYTQVVLVKGKDTFALPDNFTHEEGAVSYYPYVTAHKALFHRGQITRGKSILIIGGTRDVGAAAIQIAKAYGMNPIIATAGTEAGMHFCTERGAHHAVDHSIENFRETAKFLNDGQNFDVIFRAKDKHSHHLDIGYCKSPGGKSLYHDHIDIDVETHGYHHFKDTMALDPDDCNSSIQHVVKHLHEGIYRPHINRTWYLDQIDEAHRAMDNEEVIGDMVLTKVHRDQFIHLSNCPLRANLSKSDLPRPATYIGTINWSDPTPTWKIAQWRFNFTPDDDVMLSSVSQYLWTLAVSELFGGTLPPSTTKLTTFSFESLYDDADMSLTQEGDFKNEDASKYFQMKTNKTAQRFMEGID